jgi:phage terminase small subunit
MPQPRKSDREKKLTGTFRANRSEAATVFHGRTRLETEIPPPSDLDPAAQQEWRVLMRLAIEAGTISTTNLHCFASMAQAAAAARKAYTAAMRSGPTVRTEEGGTKTSPAWTAWVAADGVLVRWCREFGLTPMAGRMTPQLPVVGGKLHLVGE